MRLFLLFLLTAATAAPAQPLSDTEVAAELQRIRPEYEFVVSGGWWESGESEGTFRVIATLHGWEHLENRVFLQWIKTLPDEQDHRVALTLPVPEINERGWRISAPLVTMEKKQWRIIISAEHSYSREKKVFVLTPTAEFKYSVAERKK